MLAAANGVYGRWDDTKGAENIDFMPTILSRFDMIFVVRDEHDMNRDMVRSCVLQSVYAMLMLCVCDEIRKDSCLSV